MRFLALAACLIMLCMHARSIRLFRWVSGENTEDDKGVYGVKGSASSSNFPCSRSGSVAISLSDSEFAVFGGISNNSQTGDTCELNDAWIMQITDSSATQYSWNWVSGGKYCQTKGVYPSEKDVFGENNVPGARAYGCAGKIIENDHSSFFLFGGYGYGKSSNRGVMNDLWVYDTVQSEWKWITGDSEPNYHGNYVVDEASSENMPGARSYSLGFSISDTEGIIMFGWGYDSEKDGFLNDVWLVDFSSNLWSWESGSNEVDDWGVYGTKYTPSENNHPGGRCKSFGWKLPNSEKIMIFGGYGFDRYEDTLKHDGYLNDLWVYHYKSREWEWMSGSREINPLGKYGVKHHFDSPTHPGGKSLATGFVSDENEVTLFGGLGYDESKFGYLNDFFVYNYEINQWKWVHGNRSTVSTGIWGVRGGDFTTKTLPSSRAASVSFYVNRNTSFVFGGYGEDVNDHWGRLNDMFLVSLEKYCEFGENETDTCSGHGNCSEGFTCDCFENYYGNECEITWCNGKMSNETDVCSGNGICYEFEKCTCIGQYGGENCDEFSCFGINKDDEEACGNGTCVEYNVCDCGENYGGMFCTLPKCYGILQNGTNVCNSKGKCTDVDTCLCEDSYTGIECQELISLEGDYYESSNFLKIRFEIPLDELKEYEMDNSFDCSKIFRKDTYYLLGNEPDCSFEFEDDEIISKYLVMKDTDKSCIIKQDLTILINSVTQPNGQVFNVSVIYHEYTVWSAMQSIWPVFVVVPLVFLLVIVMIVVIVILCVVYEVQKRKKSTSFELDEPKEITKKGKDEDTTEVDISTQKVQSMNQGGKETKVGLSQRVDLGSKI